MPEGDTIHRTAKTLNKALAGKTLARANARNIDLSGRVVAGVEARGKNLLVMFADGSSLLTHMRMTGVWHVYKVGERWRMPQHRARAVLETSDYVAVCFDAPTIEVLRPGEADVHERLDTLGPDILADGFDVKAAAARLRERCAEQELGVAIMDQRAIAGIGNIWKSESLHRSKVSPFSRTGALDLEILERVVENAAKLMRASVAGANQTITRAAYGRSGEPCPRCGEIIRMKRQGEMQRSTYYCPACQVES